MPTRAPSRSPTPPSSAANHTRPSNASLSEVAASLEAVRQSLLAALLAALQHNASTGSTVVVASGTGTVSLAVLTPSANASSGQPWRVPLASPGSALSIAQTSSSPLLVSVVEVAASALPSTTLGGGGSTGNASTPAIYRPTLASGVLTIELSTLTTRNGSQASQSVTLPTFEASLTVQPAAGGAAGALNHSCRVGVVESVATFCAQPRVWLNLSCSGAASTRVYRACPVPKQVCSVLNLADLSVASDSYCEAVVTGASSLVCRCGYGATANASAALLGLKGRLSIAATSSYASSPLQFSVLSVTRPLAGSALVARSTWMFVLFGGLWSVGVALWALARRHVTDETKTTPLTAPAVAAALKDATQAPSSAKEAWRAYLDAIVPPAVQPLRWWPARLAKILVAKHLFCRVALRAAGYHRWVDAANGADADATTDADAIGDRRRARRTTGAQLDVVHAVTALTMSCFVLAVFYDLQSPVDDGFCGAQLDEASCLAQRTALDPGVHKCLWAPPAATDDAHVAGWLTESAQGSVFNRLALRTDTAADDDAATRACRLNPHTLSLTAFTLSFLITSTFSQLLAFLLETIFDLLAGDVADHRVATATSADDAVAAKAATVDDGCSSADQHDDEGHDGLDGHGDSDNCRHVAQRVVALRDAWLGTVRMGGAGDGSAGGGCGSCDAAAASVQRVDDTWRGVQFVHAVVGDLIAQTPSASTRQRGVAARQARYYEREVAAWFTHKPQVSWAGWRVAMAVLLVAMHGGAWYFLLSKAASRGPGWQVKFFRAVLWEWLADVVFNRTGELLLSHGLLPMWLLAGVATRPLRQVSAHCPSFLPGQLHWTTQDREAVQPLFPLAAGHVQRWQRDRESSLPPETRVLLPLLRYLAQFDRSPTAAGTATHWTARWALSVVLWCSPTTVVTTMSVAMTLLLAITAHVYFLILEPSLSSPRHVVRRYGAAMVAGGWLAVGLPIAALLGYLAVDVARRRRAVGEEELPDDASVDDSDAHVVSDDDGGASTEEDADSPSVDDDAGDADGDTGANGDDGAASRSLNVSLHLSDGTAASSLSASRSASESRLSRGVSRLSLLFSYDHGDEDDGATDDGAMEALYYGGGFFDEEQAMPMVEETALWALDEELYELDEPATPSWTSAALRPWRSRTASATSSRSESGASSASGWWSRLSTLSSPMRSRLCSRYTCDDSHDGSDAREVSSDACDPVEVRFAQRVV